MLIPLTVITAAFAPLVFFGGFDIALIGALLGGIGLGVHESVMSAAVTGMVPEHRRGTAFGLFTAIFGIAWFIGSAVQGAPYDFSIPALVAVLPILIAARLSR